MVKALLLVLLAGVPAPGPAVEFLPAAQVGVPQMGQYPFAHGLVIDQPLPAPVADKGLARQTAVEIVVVGFSVVGGAGQVGQQAAQQPRPVQAAGDGPSQEQPVAIPQPFVTFGCGLLAQSGQVVMDDIGDALLLRLGQVAQTGEAARRIHKKIAEQHQQQRNALAQTDQFGAQFGRLAQQAQVALGQRRAFPPPLGRIADQQTAGGCLVQGRQFAFDQPGHLLPSRRRHQHVIAQGVGRPQALHLLHQPAAYLLAGRFYGVQGQQHQRAGFGGKAVVLGDFAVGVEGLQGLGKGVGQGRCHLLAAAGHCQ